MAYVINEAAERRIHNEFEDVNLEGDSLDDAFPSVEPGVVPLGARVLVQIKTVKRVSAGGILLVEESKETEKWNTQVAKVVALGPLAFCNRETSQPWPEGMWATQGDFVRVPRWGGDRFEIQVPGQKDPALFVIYNDHELIAKITSDPLKFKNYIL
jgi:co-chaperonin GroES (HSP10)